MTARRNKPAGLRWLQGAFGAFSPCVTCQESRRNAFELEAWNLVACADDQTQRAIFGETVLELLENETDDSDHAEFWNWRTNPMNAAKIGRFAISLSNAGKKRLLKLIADRREWGHSWRDIAASVENLRHSVRNQNSSPSWLVCDDIKAGEYQYRGSSRAVIYELAERVFEQGAAK